MLVVGCSRRNFRDNYDVLNDVSVNKTHSCAFGNFTSADREIKDEDSLQTHANRRSKVELCLTSLVDRFVV